MEIAILCANKVSITMNRQMEWRVKYINDNGFVRECGMLKNH